MPRTSNSSAPFWSPKNEKHLQIGRGRARGSRALPRQSSNTGRCRTGSSACQRAKARRSSWRAATKTLLPLLLLHGGMANSAMWMGDVAAWAAHFRVYAVDVIGEAGLSAPSRPPLASDAHALWLDDVMQALSLTRVSIVGVSLGGWLALDYATRRPERVESVAVLCPAGVGRQKISIVFKTIPLRMLGALGQAQSGRTGSRDARQPTPSPALQYFMDFMSLIHKNSPPADGEAARSSATRRCSG